MHISSAIILIILSLGSIQCEHFISYGKVCDGIDVKVISDFKKIEECQIIEGSVKIHIDENLTPEMLGNITFPLVTEIAGHLMIFKTSGLKTLNQLFPNLVAIRGGELIKGYGLIVYGNPDLENIGLSHLKTISNGAVRIEKNLKLCFVNTIEWSVILNNETAGKNIFDGNMPLELCPLCQNGLSNCWNIQTPQTFCSCEGNSCNENGTCCEPSCLSCRDDIREECTVCKQFLAGIHPNQKCVDSCPYRTYQFLSHRCITVEECKNLNINSTSMVPFIAFQGICQQGCPDEFHVKYAIDGNKMSAACTPCTGRECWKKCKAVKLDTIEAAESLKGCQVIEGALDIQMKANSAVNIEKVLETSLSDIIEIEDYLKISRSYSILTLRFLKNLRKIYGKQLENQRDAIFIWDNENLENLFEDSQQIEIVNGNLYIHFNPKLCFDKVERFSKITGKEIEDVKNAQFSNGNKKSCNITKFQTDVIEVSKNSANLIWISLKNEIDSEILDYVIFYIQAPEQNIDLWTSRDTCGNDGWTAVDVENLEKSADRISYNLTELQAYTQYAFYVKAYSTSRTAQSEIKYFKTLASKPETVTFLTATSKSDSEILLSWRPPKNTNGQLENYEIEISKLDVMKDILQQRNFCEHPFDISELNHDDFPKLNQTQGVKKNSTTVDFESEIEVLFNSRKKRSNEIECPQENSKYEADSLLKFETISVDAKDTNILINSLDHFNVYAISIRACRKADNKSEDDLCSDDSQIVAKTLKSNTADVVNDFEANALPSNSSEHQVKLSWNPPKNPNGKILNYVVKMKKVDEPNMGHEELICISLFNRSNVCSQIIPEIKPGNYSFQIMCVTLAGDFGNFSNPKFVHLKSVSHFGLITSPAFMSLLFLIAVSTISVFVYNIYKRNQGPELVSNFENFDYDEHQMT